MAQETWAVTEVVQETPVQQTTAPVVQEDKRWFFDKVLDIWEEYIEQWKEFVTDVYNNFSKLDSWNEYQIKWTDVYSQEIIKEADKTTLDRAIEATWKFIDTSLNFWKSFFEWEDSFVKWLTGTDIFRNQQSAETANEMIKQFYNRNDVQTEKDPNKQYELQQELYNKIKPFIKPEKSLSDEDIKIAIDELSISKQQAKQQKELENDKLTSLMNEEVNSVVNKKFVWWEALYNQALIEWFKKWASQELSEVLEMKKDLQISALELWIDKDEVQKRIDKLDKIIDIKKRQIDAWLETAFMDKDAFNREWNGELKIYNKAMSWLSNDEINTLLDYERNNTKDINTLLNVNRLNQLKKWWISDRLWAWSSTLQWAAWLWFDLVDTLLWIKTIAWWAVWRSYSTDDRESMINALSSDENYLTLANRTWAAYVLRSALSNFDDIWQVIIWGWVQNRLSWVNKVVKYLDWVTWTVKRALATWAKWVIESYAFNNQLSMWANEVNSDDYQMMNAIIDPFAENVMNFMWYMTRTVWSKFNLDYISLWSARDFKEYMIKNWDESYKNRDIDDVMLDLKATTQIIRSNVDKSKQREILKTPETIAQKWLDMMKEIEETWWYTYKHDWFIVNYSNAIEKTSSPSYIFNNAGSIITNTDKRYLNDVLSYYSNNPEKVLYKWMPAEEEAIVKEWLSFIKEAIPKLNTLNDVDKAKTINDITQYWYKISNSIKWNKSFNTKTIWIFSLDTWKRYEVKMNENTLEPELTAEMWKTYMFQESKYKQEDYNFVNDLVKWSLKSKTTAKDIKHNLSLVLWIEKDLIWIGGEKPWRELLRIEQSSVLDPTFKVVSAREEDGINIDNLKLVQKWMQQHEIISLLMSKDSYWQTLKNLQDMDKVLRNTMPLLSKIFKTNIELIDFRNAARIFMSSDIVRWTIKGTWTGDINELSLQNLLLAGAAKVSDNTELLWTIMRLDDDTIWKISKAELISSMFTWATRFDYKLDYRQTLKDMWIKNIDGIVWKQTKSVFHKLEKVFKEIEKYDPIKWKLFRSNFMKVNSELTNMLFKISASDSVFRSMDPTYNTVIDNIFDAKNKIRTQIQQYKDIYDIWNPNTTTWLLSALKKLLKTETDSTKKTKLTEAISKIENARVIQLEPKRRLQDLVTSIKLINSWIKWKDLEDLLNTKSELVDIIKDLWERVWDWDFDNDILQELNNFQIAYINKNIEIQWWQKELLKQVKELEIAISNMEHWMSDYTWYINDSWDILDFSSTPVVNSVKSILLYDPSSKLHRYNKEEETIYDILMKHYDTDIKAIRRSSSTESEFHFKLLNTKWWKILLNMFPSASSNVEPLSLSKMLKDAWEWSTFIDKIKIIDNNILNIQKYYISRWIEIDDEMKESLRVVRSKYLYEITKSEIDIINDVWEAKTLIQILFSYIKSWFDIWKATDKDWKINIKEIDDQLEVLISNLTWENAMKKVWSVLANIIVTWDPKKVLFDKASKINFYDAEQIVNKKLLEWSPIDIILKVWLWIDYDKIWTELIKALQIEINKSWNSKKSFKQLIKDWWDKFYKYKDLWIDKIINFLDTNIVDKWDQKLAINDILLWAKDELIKIINNKILDHILWNIPNSFKNKVLLSYDTWFIWDIFKWIGWIEWLYKIPQIKSLFDIVWKPNIDKLVEWFKNANNQFYNNKFETKIDINEQNDLINSIIDWINNNLDNTSDIVPWKTLYKIMIDNDKEIRNNLSNSLRSISEKEWRDIVVFNWLYWVKSSQLTESSDWVNQIFNLKYLLEVSTDWISNKYNTVKQFEFWQSFYSQISKATQLDNATSKTIFNAINNIKYIYETLWLWIPTANNVDWENFGLSSWVITEDIFNRLYNQTYVWRHYLAMPTAWEEANKWFAVDPSKYLLEKLINKNIEISNNRHILRNIKIWEVNNLIDNEVFKDVLKVTQLYNGTTRSDFAKRLKWIFAWWAWVLRKEEDITSIQLLDPLLLDFYNVKNVLQSTNGEDIFNDYDIESIINWNKNISDEKKKFIQKLLDWKIKDNEWKDISWVVIKKLLEWDSIELSQIQKYDIYTNLKKRESKIIWWDSSLLTDKEVKEIAQLLKSEWYKDSIDIPEKVYTFKDLIEDDIKSLKKEALLLTDKLDIISWMARKKLDEMLWWLDLNNKDKLLKLINDAKNNPDLDQVKEIKWELIAILENAEKLILSTDAKWKIIPAQVWVNLETLIKDKWAVDASGKHRNMFASNSFVYLLAKKESKILNLIEEWIKDTDNIKSFESMISDRWWKWWDLLNIVWEHILKEPTDWMWYMSRNMAEAIYSDRTFKEFDSNLSDEVLPDLKAHMLQDWVFEKSRQSTLSKEQDAHIREKLWLSADEKFVISFRSAVKTGKDKYELFNKWEEIELYGTKVKAFWKRKISSSQIKIAASDAVQDKDKVTLSMQYLAPQDPILFKWLQKWLIWKALKKVQEVWSKFKMWKVLTENKWVHNMQTLHEMVLNNERELFNQVKWIKADGSMLKLTWESKFKNEEWEFKDLERNALYVSKYKFENLLKEWKLKKIWNDTEWNPQYAVLAFRNPVPSPYNVSLVNIKIDYSLRGKNAKIHPMDTFLKKEADFDADTINLVTEWDDSFTYKTLFLSSLKQTNIRFDHWITFKDAQWDSKIFEEKINEAYERASKILNEELNKKTFYNRFVPTEQVWSDVVDPLRAKSAFAKWTLQWALIEAAVAKEQIWIVSVSQEWLNYIINSIHEYNTTWELWNELVWWMTIRTMADILDISSDDFYTTFASILQITLDYAKSNEKFPDDWLDNQIMAMMKNKDDKEWLEDIKTNLQSFAMNIKMFKDMEISEFLEDGIQNLPPVLNDRYAMIRKAMLDVEELKIKEWELDKSYSDFFISELAKDKSKDVNKEITYSIINKDWVPTEYKFNMNNFVSDFYSQKKYIPKEKRQAAMEYMLWKDNTLVIFDKFFNNDSLELNAEKLGIRNQVTFNSNDDRFKALYEFIKLKKWSESNLQSYEDEFYDMILVWKAPNQQKKFTYDVNNFNSLQLIRKYWDAKMEALRLDSKKIISTSEAFGFLLVWYKNTNMILDQLNKVNQVVTNMKLLTHISVKERKAYLEWKWQIKLYNDIENKIQNLFDNSDEYKFITEITWIRNYKEFKESWYNLDLTKVWENYDVSIDRISKWYVDQIIEEVYIKNNASETLRNMINNIDDYAQNKVNVAHLKIDSEWKLINTNKIEIEENYTPNTINIIDELMKDDTKGWYRDSVMKKTYELNPNNALLVMKDLEDISRAIWNKYSWNMYDKMVKFAPRIAERFTQRDFIRWTWLRKLLDSVQEIRSDWIDDWLKKHIENHLFIQAWKWTNISKYTIKNEDPVIVEKAEKYQDELFNIITSWDILHNMIKKIKYNTSYLDSNYSKSYLMDFLELENGQHMWALHEFGAWWSKDDFKRYIEKEALNNPTMKINEMELENFVNEVFNLNNKNWAWRAIRKIKSNMYVLAFSPIIVPAALAVTLLQMIPDFFINMSKKSQSFNDPFVNRLLRQGKVLDWEVIQHIKNIHDTADTWLVERPLGWVFNFLKKFWDNPTYQKILSNVELIATNWFAANDVILWPLRRQVAATRAFDTLVDNLWGMEKFKAQYVWDTEAMDKFMSLVRMHAHSNFIDISWWSSTSRLWQSTVFSSNIHNMWNFMQWWSTIMVNQHVKWASDVFSAVRLLANWDTKWAKVRFKEFSNYLWGQLRMNIAIAAALAKYQIVFNENRNEDWEYDIMSYIKTLNTTLAWLESFSPYWAIHNITSRFDANNWAMYNVSMIAQEITSRFGREFNLPKNLVAYVTNAVKLWVPPEKIIDWAYDVLNDRTNWFLRYGRFELQDWYFKDTYTVNMLWTALWVSDLTSYQEFKKNVREYWTQRAFEELSTTWQLAVIFGSSWYINMFTAAYWEEWSFKVYEDLVKDITDIRAKDKMLRQLISTWMDKNILDEVMFTNNKLDPEQVKDLFYKMVNYSAKWLWDSISSESWLTAFQWNKNPSWPNVIDNLVVSQLNEKYGKEIVDAIVKNDYLTISAYIKNKVWPEMLKDLYATGSDNVDEKSLRKMLLIASEKSELSIPTLVSTLIYDKAKEFQKGWFNIEQARYKAIQMYWWLANGNLWMVNDVAESYIIKKYNDQLKPLFNPKFKEAFSNSLQNKLLIDMAVWRAMYEDWDIGSAELRWDMTTIFNWAYKSMKEKNNGILSKEDSMKLMRDYTYIDTELNKLHWKVDPLKLFNYREWVFLSMLNKPDMLAEIENDDWFNKTWSDVKDNLTHRFLKFTWERKNYELDSFEDMVKDKYYKQIWLKSWSWYWSWSYGSLVRSSYKPNMWWWKWWGFGWWQWAPFVQRAMNTWMNPTSSTRDMFRSNPYSFVPSMWWPKAYYEDMKIWFEQLHKQMYEQYSKDLIKKNPEYFNKIYSIKKMWSEFVWMKSKFIRNDYQQIPRIPFARLSKWLITWWAFNREK